MPALLTIPSKQTHAKLFQPIFELDGLSNNPLQPSEWIRFKLTYIYKYEQNEFNLCQSEHHRHLILTLSHAHAFRRIQRSGSQRESLKIPAPWSVQSARIAGMNIPRMIQCGVARIHLPEDILKSNQSNLIETWKGPL